MAGVEGLEEGTPEWGIWLRERALFIRISYSWGLSAKNGFFSWALKGMKYYQDAAVF